MMGGGGGVRHALLGGEADREGVGDGEVDGGEL